MNPTSLSKAELARILTQALRGMKRPAASPDDVDRLIEAGLPTNDDGTINLLTAAAFLAETC